MADPPRPVPIDPPMTAKRAPEDPIVQMNVRIPKSLRDAIDERRDIKGLSRDRWVTNAVAWVLQQTVPAGAYRGPNGQRTIPPQRRRTP